jgi:hypothetical protein
MVADNAPGMNASDRKIRALRVYVSFLICLL